MASISFLRFPVFYILCFCVGLRVLSKTHNPLLWKGTRSPPEIKNCSPKSAQAIRSFSTVGARLDGLMNTWLDFGYLQDRNRDVVRTALSRVGLPYRYQAMRQKPRLV